MLNTVSVSADHGRDFHPLTDQMTKLRNFSISIFTLVNARKNIPLWLNR